MRAGSPTRADDERQRQALVESVKRHTDFWRLVLSCHTRFRNAEGLAAQLQNASASTTAGAASRYQLQQQQLAVIPVSRRNDLCIALRNETLDLAADFDGVIRSSLADAPTPVAACLELLSEAARLALAYVDSASMEHLFKTVFGKLPMLDGLRILDSVSGAGVVLLPDTNAESLMQTLQSLRAAYIAQRQRRSADEIRQRAGWNGQE